MKKILLPLLLFLPFLAPAQLDVIRPGMTLGELQLKFPSLEPDYAAMTSDVHGPFTMAEVKGVATWFIRRDTVMRFQFGSEPVDGACENFPNADTVQVGKLLAGARTLVSHYSDLFGKPVTLVSRPLREATGDQWIVNVIFAEWKFKNGSITISVSRPGRSIEQFNINGPAKRGDECECCKYTFDVAASGTGMEVYSEFENGITASTFRQKHPELAAQVLDHPDIWMMDDSISGREAHWQFSFRDRQLTEFNCNIYGGPAYGQPEDTAFARMNRRLAAWMKEAEVNYGKPDSASKNLPKKYSPHKASNVYYSTIHYEAKWKTKQTMVIRFSEFGGGKQGPAVFHLEVQMRREY